MILQKKSGVCCVSAHTHTPGQNKGLRMQTDLLCFSQQELNKAGNLRAVCERKRV